MVSLLLTTQVHHCRINLLPGQGCCHLPFMSLCFVLQHNPRSTPPSLWLFGQLA